MIQEIWLGNEPQENEYTINGDVQVKRTQLVEPEPPLEGNDKEYSDFVIYEYSYGGENPKYYKFNVGDKTYTVEFDGEKGLRRLREVGENRVLKRTQNSIQKFFNTRVFYQGRNMPCTEMLSIQCKRS